QRRANRGRRRDRRPDCAGHRRGRGRHPGRRQRHFRRGGPRTGHPGPARRGRSGGRVVMPASVSSLRVRYAETDKMGVVYYANYLVWFEVARADLLRTLGWSYREMEIAGISLPVIEAQCQYLRPARYDDEIEVKTEGRMVSPVRMEFQYQVIRK